MKKANKILGAILALVMLMCGAGQVVFAADGDLARVEMAADDSYPERVATYVWGFRLIFSGNTTDVQMSEISDLKLFINGAEQIVPSYFGAEPYYVDVWNETVYDFIFDTDLTQKPAQYWITFQYRGVM